MDTQVRNAFEREAGQQERERPMIGGPRLKMSAQPLPGYSCYWCNDEDNHVFELLQNGYTFVMLSEVSDLAPVLGTYAADGGSDKGRVSKVVGTRKDGAPLIAYLMKIPTELFEENQAFYQIKPDQIDANILRGNVNGKIGHDGRYVPSSAPIKLSVQTGRKP